MRTAEPTSTKEQHAAAGGVVCAGTTISGEPCRQKARLGGSYCPLHDPERKEPKARRRSSTFGHVRKLPSGRYQAVYTCDDERHVAPDTFRTKADANVYLSGIETDLKRGTWIDPRAGNVSFSDFANSWLRSRPDLRPRSKMLYRSLLDRHLIPIFGHLPISEIAPSQIRIWHAELLAKTPGTASSAYRLVRAIFNTAVQDELLLRSPCRVPKGGADRAKERPLLTLAEVQALTDAMPDNLQSAVTLAAWGALRRGEVLGLRRRDVDPLRSRVRVERAQLELDDGKVLFTDPKTDAGIRDVHLPEQAMRAVNAHLDAYVSSHRDALLFTGRTGNPLRAQTLETAFRKARLACGLPQARFHDLRHFSLTVAAAAGASTKELMRRAGHSSADAALRYQHASEDRDAFIARALGELVRADVVTLPSAATRNA
jgi:integrase